MNSGRFLEIVRAKLFPPLRFHDLPPALLARSSQPGFSKYFRQIAANVPYPQVMPLPFVKPDFLAVCTNIDSVVVISGEFELERNPLALRTYQRAKGVVCVRQCLDYL